MSGIADSPGVYEDFSGRIKWERTNCEVRGADFEILEDKKQFKNKVDIWIEFERGNVVSGVLCYTNIKYCNFIGSSILVSVFHNGVFSGQGFESSYWLGGKWKSGEWGEENYDKFGRERLLPPPFDRIDYASGAITQPGRYRKFTGQVKFSGSDFIIRNGDLEVNERFGYNLAINDGEIVEGFIDFSLINYVKFSGGIINLSFWRDGIFLGGTWESGMWYDGTWMNGTWYGGLDKNSDYHKENDSPDEWDI